MKVTVCRFATLFPVTISLPFSIFPGEDEALEDFLAKDREEELKRHKTSMAETRKLVRDVMQRIGAVVRWSTSKRRKNLFFR